MIIKLGVTGMTCAAYAARVENAVSKVPGVVKAEVNLLAGKLTAQVEHKEVEQDIIRAIRAAGYDVVETGKPARNKQDSFEKKKNTLIRILVSLALLLTLMYFTMGHMAGLPLPAWYHGTNNAVVAALTQLFLTIPVVVLNRQYYTRGFRALINRAPNMDSLIAVGSGAALVYGSIVLFLMAAAMGAGDWETVERHSANLYFESAAMILTLITIGKYLEERAKGKTGDAIRALMDLSPKTASVRRNGVVLEIPVEQVRVGDIVLVKSGGAIPVDGIVTEGRAAIDQSALTGESVPVEVKCGDAVTAATLNTEGYIEFRAERVGEDTTLAQIIHMVEEAGGSKAPIARLADKIAGVFVPTVMAISLVTFIAWMVAGQTFEFALSAGISVLVISCPCALGLATPVAIMVGTGRGAGFGVLFKNAQALETLHSIDTVVLDKTGTLTTGVPAVTDVIPLSVSKEELLCIAATIESKSEHPFAKAILKANVDRNLRVAAEFETLPGMGVSAIIDNIRYFGGNRRLMESLNISAPEYKQLTVAGKTPLYFASEKGELLGVIATADVLKTDSRQAVESMQQMHLHVVMLTGDNGDTANAIAEEVGIHTIIADVLPADKANAIKRLQGQGKKVLMVGDGINDAPALVQADSGIAIGAGTDIAIEAADIVLIKNSLQDVSNAIRLSKATIRNIRQNLFWAFFYNCLGIPVAAGVLYPAFGILLSPMIGAAAMSMSSFFVVSNALRLRFFKPKTMDGLVVPLEEAKHKEDIKMETIIHVNGMMCPHCKARVESVCKGFAGVQDAVVDLQLKQVTVVGHAPVSEIKKAIVESGYEVVD